MLAKSGSSLVGEGVGGLNVLYIYYTYTEVPDSTCVTVYNIWFKVKNGFSCISKYIKRYSVEGYSK